MREKKILIEDARETDTVAMQRTDAIESFSLISLALLKMVWILSWQISTAAARQFSKTSSIRAEETWHLGSLPFNDALGRPVEGRPGIALRAHSGGPPR